MDFTLTANVFPNGTLVKAYPKSNWPTPGVPSGTPVGAASSEQTRASDELTFTGLVTGDEYWAVASVGGAYRYVGFTAGGNTSSGSVESQVEVINLGSDWSDGDLLGARLTLPPAAHKRDIRDGTAAAPVKLGVTESISRVDATTRAELNAMGPTGTDGPDGASAVRIAIKGTAASEVQVTSLALRAWQTGAYAGGEASADATPLMALSRVSGAGTGRAIPAYFESVRETSTSGGQQGIEIRVKNESGEADNYVSGSGSKSMGVWLCASGASRSAAGFQIGHNFGQQFDVGYAANAESLVSAFMRDDSSALRSVFIRGAHEKGAIVVNKGAGQVIIGREEPQQPTPLLEVFSDSALDPIVSFGSNTGLSQRAQLIRNASGNMGAFVSNVANAFLTGTAQGDVGLTFTAGKILHVGAATKASQLRISETGIGFFTTAPQAKPTGVAKTAEGLWTALNTLGLIA